MYNEGKRHITRGEERGEVAVLIRNFCYDGLIVLRIYLIQCVGMKIHLSRGFQINPLLRHLLE